MIRRTALYVASVLFVAGCASNNGFKTDQSFAPAKFQVSDVYVNMVDGVENSKRVGGLFKNAGKNTASVYNGTMSSVSAEYPMEIEVSEINYRSPTASAASGDRTYIRYTATLREEASGEVFRSLPVTYYHISTGTLATDEAKQNAEKNMIRISIKNAFARLYGMENIPKSVQTHFNTNDIFSDRNLVNTKPLIKPVKKAPAPVVAAVIAQQPAAVVASDPDIVAPNEAITETTSEDGATVIKCVVC